MERGEAFVTLTITQHPDSKELPTFGLAVWPGKNDPKSSTPLRFQLQFTELDTPQAFVTATDNVKQAHMGNGKIVAHTHDFGTMSRIPRAKRTLDEGIIDTSSQLDSFACSINLKDYPETELFHSTSPGAHETSERFIKTTDLSFEIYLGLPLPEPLEPGKTKQGKLEREHPFTQLAKVMGLKGVRSGPEGPPIDPISLVIQVGPGLYPSKVTESSCYKRITDKVPELKVMELKESIKKIRDDLYDACVVALSWRVVWLV
ncbi:hypothetical protein FB451DRAFT_1164250 [Mycena latifolia]|nr:hypothetical protein FB451DRAFT_1164250 [Mycena latifolia]